VLSHTAKYEEVSFTIYWIFTSEPSFIKRSADTDLLKASYILRNSAPTSSNVFKSATSFKKYKANSNLAAGAVTHTSGNAGKYLRFGATHSSCTFN
jgi:hypothetical protein